MGIQFIDSPGKVAWWDLVKSFTDQTTQLLIPMLVNYICIPSMPLEPLLNECGLVRHVGYSGIR